METMRTYNYRSVRNGNIVEGCGTQYAIEESSDNTKSKIIISKNGDEKIDFISFDEINKHSENSFRDEHHYWNPEFSEGGDDVGDIVGSMSEVTEMDIDDAHIIIEEKYGCFVKNASIKDAKKAVPFENYSLEGISVSTRTTNSSGVKYTGVANTKYDIGDDGSTIETNYLTSVYTLPPVEDSPFDDSAQFVAINSMEPGKTGVTLAAFAVTDDTEKLPMIFKFENFGTRDSEADWFIHIPVMYNGLDADLIVNADHVKDGKVLMTFELFTDNKTIRVHMPLSVFKTGELGDVNPSEIQCISTTESETNQFNETVVGDLDLCSEITSLVSWDEVIGKVNSVLEYLTTTEIAGITFWFEDGEAHFEPDPIE